MLSSRLTGNYGPVRDTTVGATAQRRYVPGLAVLALGLSGTGCTLATYHDNGAKQTHTVEEFRAYARELHAHHNELGLEAIVVLAESDEYSDDHDLSRAEARASRSCRTLNEVAQKRLRREKISLMQRLALIRGIPSCDRDTRALEQALEEFRPQG